MANSLILKWHEGVGPSIQLGQWKILQGEFFVECWEFEK